MALVVGSGTFVPTVRYGASQDVTISGSSAQSTAIGTAGHTPNRLLRIVSTTDCRIATGSNPTATSTSTFLPASSVEFVELTPGDKVAVIQESAGGKLNITDCIF